MIAEIHSKISSSGSNLSDRAEDQLTGNVFGSLRYLPVEAGLKKVLEKAKFENEDLDRDFQEDVAAIPNAFWGDCCQFWPRHAEGEIDLLLKFPASIIGIEVKFHSELSSDDGVNNSQENVANVEESKNQLAREIKIVDWYCRQEERKKRGWLILLAKQGEPEAIVDDARRRNILKGESRVGVLSWTSVLEALKSVNVENLDSYQKLILLELVTLLHKKGFDRFCDFSIKEPQIVNASLYFYFPISSVPFSFDTALKVNAHEYFRITS